MITHRGASSSSVFEKQSGTKIGEVARSAGGVSEMPARHNFPQKRVEIKFRIMHYFNPLPALPYSPYRLISTVLRCATEGELADACY